MRDNVRGTIADPAVRLTARVAEYTEPQPDEPNENTWRVCMAVKLLRPVLYSVDASDLNFLNEQFCELFTIVAEERGIELN